MKDYEKQTIKSEEIRGTYLGGCSNVTFWRLRKKDDSFPKPIRIGGLLLWDRAQVECWYLQLMEVSQNV